MCMYNALWKYQPTYIFLWNYLKGLLLLSTRSTFISFFSKPCPFRHFHLFCFLVYGMLHFHNFHCRILCTTSLFVPLSNISPHLALAFDLLIRQRYNFCTHSLDLHHLLKWYEVLEKVRLMVKSSEFGLYFYQYSTINLW